MRLNGNTTFLPDKSAIFYESKGYSGQSKGKKKNPSSELAYT